MLGREVEGLSLRIAIVHVAANSNGTLGGETFFPALASAYIAQDSTAMSENGVRDDLLEAGVCFCEGPRHESGRWGGEEFVQITVHLEVQSLEGAEAVKFRAGNYQNHFFSHMRFFDGKGFLSSLRVIGIGKGGDARVRKRRTLRGSGGR